MLETFTEAAKQSLFFARYEASKTGSSAIEVEHLALGVLRADLALGWKVFPSRDDIRKVRDRIEREIPKGAEVTASVDIPLSMHCQRVLSYATAEAERLGDKNTGTVHLLMGILRENGSVTAGVLREYGVTVERLDTPGPVAPIAIEGIRNLVTEAGQGKLPALIGRERELEQMIQILSRRTRSNAVLVGEPGVGKESLVFGLARRVADDAVPEGLLDAPIYAVDARDLAREFSPNRPQTPAHVRAALDVDGAILYVRGLFDLREALPLAAKHFKEKQARWIATAGPLSFRLALDRDDEVARCFEAVSVAAPTAEETVAIVDAAKEGFERFHGVAISAEAVQAAVVAAGRFLRDRSLPDSVLDLIDDAGARVKLRSAALPPNVTAIKRRLSELVQEMERAIATHHFEEAKRLSDSVDKLRAELAGMKSELPAAKQQKSVSAEDVLEAVAARCLISVEAVKAALARAEEPDLMTKLCARIPPGRRDWVPGLYAHLTTCSSDDAEQLAEAIRDYSRLIKLAT
jgi:ATP-dependent Clp protease ATP-binding subunit ClpC